MDGSPPKTNRKVRFSLPEPAVPAVPSTTPVQKQRMAHGTMQYVNGTLISQSQQTAAATAAQTRAHQSLQITPTPTSATASLHASSAGFKPKELNNKIVLHLRPSVSSLDSGSELSSPKGSPGSSNEAKTARQKAFAQKSGNNSSASLSGGTGASRSLKSLPSINQKFPSSEDVNNNAGSRQRSGDDLGGLWNHPTKKPTIILRTIASSGSQTHPAKAPLTARTRAKSMGKLPGGVAGPAGRQSKSLISPHLAPMDGALARGQDSTTHGKSGEMNGGGGDAKDRRIEEINVSSIIRQSGQPAGNGNHRSMYGKGGQFLAVPEYTDRYEGMETAVSATLNDEEEDEFEDSEQDGSGGGGSGTGNMPSGLAAVDGKDAATKQFEYNVEQDSSIVKILCEWAVSWQRWGEHRAMVVAWLLDKRQNEVLTALENDSYTNNLNNSDDKDSVLSGSGLNGGQPVFQHILMNFLDHDAPVLDEAGSPQNKSQFTNLVHLFSELIRHDVFSHDAYMCCLISRGDLLTGAGGMLSLDSQGICNAGLGTGPISNKPATSSSPNGGGGVEDDVLQTDFKAKLEDLDDSNVDDDLDKLLQHIKEDQQNSMDAPDSPKDPEHAAPSVTGLGKAESSSRHFLYTEHFPLCQDDPISQHDCNQRYILLYGVGKERDEKKHAVKKMSKEICKLFSKKFSIDVAEGGKVKKHSRSEFNFESTSNKCQAMSYFDQHVVTWQCAVQVQEMLNAFAIGNSNYLPVQEHVAFLFDLMESAFNIYGLIDTCIQILRELPEVELQLIGKSSMALVRSYTTSLSLYVVGVLRRYHCCLLLSQEQTTAIFEGLCRIVKHVSNPSDCSSAERCILAYLYDLYSACSSLKARPQQEPFHNAYPKIKQALYTPLQPTPSAHTYNPQFMLDIITNPRRGGKIESGWARQLNESASNRYSFVCNAVVAVTRDIDNDCLNDIAAMCAELTACCNSLSTEWLGVLIALCGSNRDAGYYVDVLTQVDVQNTNIHNALSVFTSILVARHCFSLENFVAHVALPSLVQACKGRGETTPEIEAGARLSCHLLLRLFKTIECPQPGLYSVSTSPNPITVGNAHNIKLSCDRHLLAAAHKNIGVAPVLAVLKGILVVGDATAHKVSSIFGSGKRSGLNTPVHPGSTPKSMAGSGDLSHILGTSDLSILGNPDESMLDVSQQNSHLNQDNATSLSDFAQHVLRQICSQEWVLERCLQHAEELCQHGMLIDNLLTAKQAQRLLHMICYPEHESNLIAELDQKAIIVRILENLEQWSLRISWLDLQLMFKQTNCSSPDLSNWLDMVARAAIDVFRVNEFILNSPDVKQEKVKPSTWLVAPLVSKLPSAVQGRILKVSGQVLESTSMFSKHKDGNGGNNSSSNNSHNHGANSNSSVSSNGSTFGSKQSAQLNHQPFLGLVLTCLKGQDEQKEGLLQSLYSQLSQFLQNRDQSLETIGGIEDPCGFEKMLDALQLRYSLVGGLFDAIMKNATSTTDWAILFAQLISQGVIDLSNNSELFTTTLDMLATLIHSTLVSDSQTERDENKKLYTNLMKKLRKELGDKNGPSIKYVRQLLPLAKQTCEVLTCDSAGSSTDAKGNKIAIDSIEKKNGLRLGDKQRVSVWDLLEGHKNPAPLSWAWFGAVKIERKPLAYEETHRLLKYHTHSLFKPSSYYYEPLPLPPEEVDPLPDKLKDDMKADTPSSDQSPAPSTGSKKSKTTTRKRKTKATAAAQVQQSQPQQPIMPAIVPQPAAGPQQMQQMQQQQQQQQQQQHHHQQQLASSSQHPLHHYSHHPREAMRESVIDHHHPHHPHHPQHHQHQPQHQPHPHQQHLQQQQQQQQQQQETEEVEPEVEQSNENNEEQVIEVEEPEEPVTVVDVPESAIQTEDRVIHSTTPTIIEDVDDAPQPNSIIPLSTEERSSSEPPKSINVVRIENVTESTNQRPRASSAPRIIITDDTEKSAGESTDLETTTVVEIVEQPSPEPVEQPPVFAKPYPAVPTELSPPPTQCVGDSAQTAASAPEQIVVPHLPEGVATPDGQPVD